MVTQIYNYLADYQYIYVLFNYYFDELVDKNPLENNRNIFAIKFFIFTVKNVVTNRNQKI